MTESHDFGHAPGKALQGEISALGGLNLDRWNTGADTGFPEGGGGEDIHKHPPLDIVRVTSSALQKIEKHPHSWTFSASQAHTPWTLPV